MEFRILGPLEVIGPEGPLVVRGAKRRGLLAYLLVHAGEAVSLDRLVDDLWDQRPSSGARGTVQSYLSGLRKVLAAGGGVALATQPSGYVLTIPRDCLDAARFERLCAEAVSQADAAERLDRVEQALGLWRGQPFGEFAGSAWADVEATRLEALRLQAVQQRVDAQLALGRHGDVIPELEGLVAEHQLDERLWAQLVVAYYRAGRQADALRGCQRVRSILADELGIEPGAELAKLERQILDHDPVLDLAPSADQAVSPTESLPEGVGTGPRGTVTFLFTDVESSAAHWERDPVAMTAAQAMHDEIVQAQIEARDGTVFSRSGDGVASVFARADDAVGAALNLQRALSSADWPVGTALKVRMGLHTGEGDERAGDYFGPAVNRAARVADAANGSQIFLSGTTADIVAHELPPDAILVDLGDHHLRDIPGSVRLLRLELPELTRDRRPPRTGNAQAGNVPTSADPLVGRAVEVEQVIEDLRSARIVTLTGVGGVGKTRLAIEVGRRLQPARRDGVWLARLDDVNRPSAMLEALLGLLGIEARTAGSDLEALIDSLRFRRALLILDNCEHLLDAAAEVASKITSSCPDVEVLATSREVLDVAGERVRRVQPLGTGNDGPAVELFFARAESGGARLDRTEDAAVVGDICRRLDGIPLAIELAAARARTLRPAQILERLHDMFRLLTSGKRRGVERHRTLQATLEWSYDLLSEQESAVLARLAVFAGSFSLDAAEAVGGSDLLERDGFIDVIDQLVARSLVVPVEEADESRFRLLEPVRQFAAERLTERGESDRIREAHARFYSGLIVDLSDRWRAGDDQGAWPVAARELANLRVAFDWLVETDRVDEAQRFAVAGLGPIVLHFDYSPEFDWAPRAVSLDADHVGRWTASACAVAAWGAMSRGDTEGAETFIGIGAAALSKGSIDEGLLTAAALHNVTFGGERVVSEDFLERSTNAALASGDLHRQVWVLSYRGRGDEAVAAAEELGNQVLLLLARTAVWPGNEQGRWELLEESWEIAQRSHSFVMRNMAAHRLGAFHVRYGAPLDGLLLLRTPARDWLIRGDARVWDVLYSIAAGLAALGDLEAADRLRDAIGDRHIGTVVSRQPATARVLPLDERDLLEAALDHFERPGRLLGAAPVDASAAVALALDRIEALASEAQEAAARSDTDAIELTGRQLEVARLVARGCSNKAIAARLGVSRYTVETHVRNILDRLDATSRTQIVAWVMGHDSP